MIKSKQFGVKLISDARLDRVSLEFFDGCHAFLDSLLVKGNEVRIACRDAFSKTLVDVLE